jgi:hypothetical protein
LENGPPDLPDFIKIAMTLGATLITVIGGWLVAVSPKFGTRRKDQIDQLQEDLDKLRNIVDQLDSTVSKQRTAMNKMFSRDIAWVQRNWDLEKSIIQAGGVVPVLPLILQIPITIED